MDELWMDAALEEAALAYEKEEVPIGAVAVFNNEIVARAHNLRESEADPTAHAEIIVLREASRKLGSWRLTGVRLYVTLEPCTMCAGAIVLARIDTVIYGAADPKAGAVRSLYNILDDNRLNHQVKIISGVKEEECSNILKSFFQSRRIKEKPSGKPF